MTKKFRIFTHQKIYLLPFLFAFTFNFLFINKIVLGQECPQEVELSEQQIMGQCRSIVNCRHFVAMIQNNNCIKNKSLVLHKATTILSQLSHLQNQARERRDQTERRLPEQGEQTNEQSEDSTQSPRVVSGILNPDFNNAVQRQSDCSTQLAPDFVGPVHPICQQQAERQRQEEEYLACERKANSAWKSACNGSLFSQAAIEVIRQFQNSKNTGDVKAMCESAKSLNRWAVYINAGVLTVCVTALTRCVRTCNAAAGKSDNEGQVRPRRTHLQYRAEQLADECSSDRIKYTALGALQLARNLQAAMSAQKCEEQVTDTNDGGDTPAVPEPTPTCEGLSGRALSNCRSNPPLAPRGNRIANTPLKFTNPGKGNPLPKINDPKFDPDDHLKGTGAEGEDQLVKSGKYTGNGDMQASSLGGLATGGGSGGGSGGFGGSFGGGGAAAASEEDGEGEEPYAEDLGPGIDKDILGDLIGGSRAGISSLGGGGFGSGIGGRLGGLAGKDNFKTPDFLKGLRGKGKNGINRNPAGLAGGTNGITAANGLTNFQKVSRAMNKKRHDKVFKQ